MAHFIFLLSLIGVIIAAVWAAAWSIRKLGIPALGPLVAGGAAGFCLVTTLIILSLAISGHDQDPSQPELNAKEAAAVAHAENMLQCRRMGGDAGWCDGFTPAVIYRNCDRTWFITLLSGDGAQVRRVLVRARGGYDGLSGGDDDPSPGERESLATRAPGAPSIDGDLKHCGR